MLSMAKNIFNRSIPIQIIMLALPVLENVIGIFGRKPPFCKAAEPRDGWDLIQIKWLELQSLCMVVRKKTNARCNGSCCEHCEGFERHGLYHLKSNVEIDDCGCYVQMLPELRPEDSLS